MNFNILILAGMGGFIGAVLRVLMGLACDKILPSNFSYSTLFVNIVGSFLIGIFISMGQSDQVKAFLVAGVCGGFTTFSSFSYECLILLQNGEMLKFGLNLLLNFALCLVACYLGILALRLNP